MTTSTVELTNLDLEELSAGVDKGPSQPQPQPRGGNLGGTRTLKQLQDAINNARLPRRPAPRGGLAPVRHA